MENKNLIVVDEAVSEKICKHFLSFLKKKGFGNLNILLISKEHPGIPDSHILHHLLNSKTIFLTMDRVFHNKILTQGLASYYVYNEEFVGKKLKGIHLKDNYSIHKNEAKIKESYHLPETDIRSSLLPSSEKKIKKLRTKRRRIRNHFGGQDHLNQVAITVSLKSNASQTLIGGAFKVSSNIGIKALDASESYICESVLPEHQNIVAVNHMLILSIQLMLHFVETHFYYDSLQMDNPLQALEQDQQNPHIKLFAELLKNFPKIEFIPSSKGRFIERLRKKLDNLSKNRTNEITVGNMSQILCNIQNHSNDT